MRSKTAAVRMRKAIAERGIPATRNRRWLCFASKSSEIGDAPIRFAVHPVWNECRTKSNSLWCEGQSGRPSHVSSRRGTGGEAGVV